MHAESLAASVFDLAAYTAQDCVAELLARESVAMVETDAYGCGTGVFTYQASDRAQVGRTFVGLLMLDESVALLSLNPDEALRLADLIEESARAESGRVTKFLDPARPVPAVDALGFEQEADTLTMRPSIAVERLRLEDGYPSPGVGLWYETGDAVNQPGDDLYGGGFTAFRLDQAGAVAAALRAAAH